MPLTHRNFTLHPVLGRITATEAAEVRDMWTSAGVLSAPEATRRTGEVLFLIRERKSGVLAGVCTVYPAPLGETAHTYWHFRMFLRPAFRGSPGLARFVLLTSHRHLQESPPPSARDTCGIAFVAENPTFRNPLTRIYFARQQPPWTRLGTDARGNEIFYCDFDR
jgi:hypothetical protein